MLLSATATTRSEPAKRYWVKIGAPIIARPLFPTATVNTPINVPRIWNCPSFSAAEPRKAAEKEVSMKPSPAVTCPEPRLDAISAPPMAAQVLAQANATMRLRSTAIPARLADSALSPIALICCPCTVRFREWNQVGGRVRHRLQQAPRKVGATDDGSEVDGRCRDEANRQWDRPHRDRRPRAERFFAYAGRPRPPACRGEGAAPEAAIVSRARSLATSQRGRPDVPLR